jgi:hypothetical protein
MLGTAAALDLRQHFVDHGIVRERPSEGRIQALQQVGDRFFVPVAAHRTFFPSATKVARRMGAVCGPREKNETSLDGIHLQAKLLLCEELVQRVTSELW